jgi:hypothetical protein
MSAYDIRTYGHRARYNRIRCRVRYLELHDLDFCYIVHDIAPDIAPDLIHNIGIYRHWARYRRTLYRVLQDIVFHETRYRVIHDGVKHDIV